MSKMIHGRQNVSRNTLTMACMFHVLSETEVILVESYEFESINYLSYRQNIFYILSYSQFSFQATKIIAASTSYLPMSIYVRLIRFLETVSYFN